MSNYEQKMNALGLGDGNGVNLAERVGSAGNTGNNSAPAGRSAIPASDPRNRASPGM